MSASVFLCFLILLAGGDFARADRDHLVGDVANSDLLGGAIPEDPIPEDPIFPPVVNIPPAPTVGKDDSDGVFAKESEDDRLRDFRDAAAAGGLDLNEFLDFLQDEAPDIFVDTPTNVSAQANGPSSQVNVGVSQDSRNRNSNRNRIEDEDQREDREPPRSRYPANVVRAFQVLEERIRTAPSYEDRREIRKDVQENIDDKAPAIPHRGLASERGSIPGGQGPDLSRRARGRNDSRGGSNLKPQSPDRESRAPIADLVANSGTILPQITSKDTVPAGEVPSIEGTKIASPISSVLRGQKVPGGGNPELLPSETKRPTIMPQYGSTSGVITTSSGNSAVGSSGTGSVQDSKRKRLQQAMQYLLTIQKARSTNSSGTAQVKDDVRVAREKLGPKGGESSGYALSVIPPHFVFRAFSTRSSGVRSGPESALVVSFKQRTGLTEDQAWRLYYFVNLLAWVATLGIAYWVLTYKWPVLLLALKRQRED